MAKFDIRKATGHQPNHSESQSQSSGGKYIESKRYEKPAQTPIVTPQPTENRENGNLETLYTNKEFALFDTIVTHKYLAKLSESPIVPLSKPGTKMGWRKITRIVLDKEQFFPDQLSMLYTSLHNMAKNVALVIQKNDFDDIEIYLGARDFEGYNQESSRLLEDAMQGYMPGVKSEYAMDKQFVRQKSQFVASYSGVASLCDDKKDNFVQGIEKFVDATSAIPSFTALFIADNVSDGQTDNMIKAYSALQNVISPCTQCQVSFNESETKGVSNTLTETIGDTITKTLSETVTHTSGTNSSYNESENSAITHNRSKNLIVAGWGDSWTHGKSYGKAVGEHNDKSDAIGKQEATATNKQKSDAKGTNESVTKGTTRQITYTDAHMKSRVDLLQRHIERLSSGKQYGLWSVGTYFVSPAKSTSRKLANIYRGCVTGENSDLDATAVNVWDTNNRLCDYLRNTENPRFEVDGINVSGGVTVTSKEMAVQMSLPQKSIPGLEVQERAHFGRNINGKRTEKLNDGNSLRIGVIKHLGNKSKTEVRLDAEELSKHVFVTGSTGSGKSNTTYLLIDKLLKQGKKILVIEPTKGDYRKVFGGRKDVTVYGTRPNEKNLLRINPFAFPEGIRVDEHADRLVEIFGVCWPLYAAMPAVLKDSILSAYEACGWDLYTSECKYGRLFPTVSDVVTQLKHIIATSAYSAEAKGNYVGALQTRLQALTNGVYASMLSCNSVRYEDLYEENAIVDLHHIPSPETRSLLMGLLMLGLTEWRSSQDEDSMDKPLEYVAVLEEAHCILPRVSKQQSQEGANVVGKSVEMLTSAIAEMRTYGQGFIIVDQSPSAVDEAAIRNTNTKIILNLPDGDDREIAGKAIGLTEDLKIAELAKLDTGEAIIFQRGWDEAVMADIDEMPKSKYNPLPKAENTIDFSSAKGQSPSSTFVAYFINKENEISDVDRSRLKDEILTGECSASDKVVLLDALNNNSNAQTSESVIEFLGTKQYFGKMLDRIECGSDAVRWDLRKFMADQCSIVDTKTQDIILSMTCHWASAQKKEWDEKCKQILSKKQ